MSCQQAPLWRIDILKCVMAFFHRPHNKYFSTVFRAFLLPMFLSVSMVQNIVLAESTSELVIEVTAGVDRQTTLAVVPFQWFGRGVLSEDVASIVQADLYRSGLFSPLDRASMLSRPAEIKDIMYQQWRALNVDYVLVGKLVPAGVRSDGAEALASAVMGYGFEVSLVDVVTESVVFSRFTGTGGDLRDIAHLISNQVYEALTGEPGAFATQILYVTVERKDQSTRYRLRRADADGFRIVTLFESSEPILSPAWSPDGRKVAYVSYHNDRRPTVIVQDIASGKQQVLAQFKGINGAPAWSPDGQSMAMALSKDGDPEIYLMHLADARLERLTNHYAIDTEPRWLPDGQRLIFTSDRGGNPQIYELTLETKAVKRLTFQGSYNARGAVSADGRYLAMVHRTGGQFHIAVQDLWRDTFRVLTQTPLDESPSIAPNGSMVIYATTAGGKGVLNAVSLDGDVKISLPARYGEVREPAWSPFLR